MNKNLKSRLQATICALLTLSLLAGCASSPIVVDLPARPTPKAPPEIMKPSGIDFLSELRKVFLILPEKPTQ